MNIPSSLIGDHDRKIADHILLKNALAICILRRRALGKARKLPFQLDENPAIGLKSSASTKSSNVSADSRSLISAATTSNVSSNSSRSNVEEKSNSNLYQEHPIFQNDSRKFNSSEPSAQNDISNKFSHSHIDSMANLVIPTTLPLYLSHCADIMKHGHVKGNRVASIYDYEAAEMMSFHIQQSDSTANISTYKVLDGLLMHLANLSSFQSRLYKLIILPTILPIVSLQRTGQESSDCRQAQILSLCTVLHRIVLLKPSLFEEVLVSICRILKMLYRHQMDMEHVPSASYSSSSSSSSSVNRDHERKSTSIINQFLINVLAVNMLILLEKLIDVHVKSSHGNHANVCKFNSENVMKILHQHLGQILVPVPVQEMASFYARDVKRMCLDDESFHTTNTGKTTCNGLNTGGKMMIRLYLYDIVKNIC